MIQQTGALVCRHTTEESPTDASADAPKTSRISEVDRIFPHVPVEISVSTKKPERIFGQEPPGDGIVVSGAIVIQAGFGGVIVLGDRAGVEHRAKYKEYWPPGILFLSGYLPRQYLPTSASKRAHKSRLCAGRQSYRVRFQ